MNINPLANKKPARRFFVLILIVATAVGIGYIASRVIVKSNESAVKVEVKDPY